MRLLAFAALVAVSACADLGDQFASALSDRGAARDGTNQGIRTLSMFSGDVRVRGPEGYCIDRQASRARTGFAVLAACARVSNAELLPTLDGLLTVQIGEAGSAVVSGQEEVLASLLEQDAGQALLSAGTAPVTVFGTESRDGLVLVRYSDPDAPEMQGTQATGWRAFLDLGNRSAVISLRAFETKPLAERDGEILIRTAASALAEANSDL